jgi:hypothetical protein
LKRTTTWDQTRESRKAKPPSKAYSLFVKILNEIKKIAIGKVVLRQRTTIGIKSLPKRFRLAPTKVSGLDKTDG